MIELDLVLLYFGQFLLRVSQICATIASLRCFKIRTNGSKSVGKHLPMQISGFASKANDQ